MSKDAAIRQVIRTYFESMHESSAEKANQVFHKNATVVGYQQGALATMSTEQFIGFIASQQPSPKENGDAERLEILSVEIAGETAVARVRDDYLGLTFLDTLSFIKVDDSWMIYNKLFHVES